MESNSTSWIISLNILVYWLKRGEGSLLLLRIVEQGDLTRETVFDTVEPCHRTRRLYIDS